MKLKNAECTRDGFTLVELITVLVIMTVLAATVVPSFIGFIDEIKKERYVIEAQGVRNSLELYLVDHYDEKMDAMGLLAELSSAAMCSTDHILSGYMMVTCTEGAYIEAVTVDPDEYGIIGMVYCVPGYRIELEADKVIVTRIGKEQSDDTGSGGVELDDGASSIY